MSLICNKRSTTLIEVIVSTVIFALVMAGMVSVFVSGKRHIMLSRDRMTSGGIGKFFLEPLQLAVRQDTWNSGSLACGALGLGAHSCGVSQVNNIPYTANYTVSTVAGTTLRRVVAAVNWVPS
ncbi:MAG: prepilin-type N-terminal cleavage/methylation domain-containing protein [Candidatus Omnitrophica bacterium]|nr:prepilin-type N-terminal cleavage/methylation domain-containing protein [Candidatus Omnitrophota bacterium]